MFDRFDEFDIATSQTTIHGVKSGSGPPVLLLHGIPETHLMWHRVAPALAERFAVVGHDRGARCAYRMALDHPEAISHLAVLDIVPTGEAFARANSEFSLGYWVWSFLAAPAPVPESLIAGAPDVLVDHMLDAWSDMRGAFSEGGPRRSVRFVVSGDVSSLWLMV